MNRLAEVYRLKDGSVGESDRYLGADIEKVQLDDGELAWSITSREYVTNGIHNLEDTLTHDGWAPSWVIVSSKLWISFVTYSLLVIDYATAPSSSCTF